MAAMLYPGSLCDVAGLKLGHDSDPRRPTGCTVLLCEQGATAGVDVRGAAPGTRETELLAPENTVQQIHGLLLSGGSAYGLDAAGGVMRWLRERGHGLRVGQALVPIVPAAVLFDLWLGDPGIHPDADAGYRACEAARADASAQGSLGAGCGASLGKLRGSTHAMKGGLGMASLRIDGLTLAALVVVNAAGDIYNPADGQLVAGARGDDGRPLGIIGSLREGGATASALPGAATTLGVVATDARLSKAQCKKLAQMSHDGLARTINPVHTVSDGDVMFALATGHSEAQADLARLGPLVAELSARAVLNAVRAATGLPGLPAVAELAG